MEYSLEEIMLYLDDICNYVDSILYYHSCSSRKQKELDLKEILIYLSIVPEIVKDIKDFLYDSDF